MKQVASPHTTVPFQVPEAIPEVEVLAAQINTVFQVKCGNMGMTPQLLLVSFLNSWWSHGSVHIFCLRFHKRFPYFLSKRESLK